MTDRTIFDLGMHNGLDTRFYLDKGFRVVALEANPRLAARGREAFAAEIAEGRLAIVERALWHEGGTTIPFFLNHDKDDWSSALRGWAEKGGHESEEIAVGTTTLGALFDAHGVPYYLKCDIEGADEVMARQLLADGRRPGYVSIEGSSAELMGMMAAAGYGHAQIVNQALLPWTPIPDPAREGARVDVRFTGHMSGLFGRELPPEKWKPVDAALEDYTLFRTLKARDPALAHGWIDFHFALGA